MSDFNVSPLLDAMEIGECFAKHDGVCCYFIRHPESGREFVLKHISVPASQEQVQALLLTGAYRSEEEAAVYYRKEAEALVQEAEVRKKLLDCPYILPFLGVQMEPKAEGTGYDVYAVLPKRGSLQTYLNDNAVSHLRGINMGIDLCVALAALREEGYVHGNLKPGNVFFSDTGRFLLGDFGLISTQDMQYAVLPEQYRSCYSAPELKDILGGLNPTVDIYSLGMILYRIYNGNHAPFEDEQTSAKAADEKRLAGEPLPAPLYADYELAGIIQKAVAFDPADRYRTPDEMRLELEQYMRRNAVSDHLIVPPLVADPEPLTPEQASEEAEPVQFADPEKLDETFKAAFSPDEGRKKKKKDRKKDQKDREGAPESEPEQGVEPAAPAGPEPEAAAPEEAPGQPPEEKPEARLPEDPEGSSEPETPDERRKQEEEDKKRRRRRTRAWVAFALIVALLAAALGLYEFTSLGKGRYHYFVTVEKLEVSDVTADSMKLHLTTNVDPDDFTAVCQDAYGNSFSGVFENGTASFTGLNPGTQYTLKVSLDGFHKVSGATSTFESTIPLTEVLTFSASLGSEEGAVLLNLVVKDESMEPEQWILQYGKTGGETAQTRFSGHSCQISGLDVGQEYTFRLLGTDDRCLAGQLQTVFTPPAALQAERLEVRTNGSEKAYVDWLCLSELPESWVLTCTDDAGNELPVLLNDPQLEENGYYCSATVEEVRTGVVYHLKLSAVGLFQPLTADFVDETILVTRFEAQTAPGSISLSWSANREPDGGWLVTAEYGNGAVLQQTVHGSACTLTALPLETYDIRLSAAENAETAGQTSLTVLSADTDRFSGYGISGNFSTIGTYYTPQKENWTQADLGGGTVTFRQGDDITFVITVKGSAQQSDDTVGLQFVVRDSDGRIVNVTEKTAQWNEVFRGDKWMDQIPWIPAEPGRYTFSAYINCMRVTTIGFTVPAE